MIPFQRQLGLCARRLLPGKAIISIPQSDLETLLDHRGYLFETIAEKYFPGVQVYWTHLVTSTACQ